MITQEQFEISLAIVKKYYQQVTNHQQAVKNTIEYIEKCNPDTHIADLDLGVRAYNILNLLITRKFGNVIPTLHHITTFTEKDIISVRGCGQSVLDVIIKTLDYYGYSLKAHTTDK